MPTFDNIKDNKVDNKVVCHGRSQNKDNKTDNITWLQTHMWALGLCETKSLIVIRLIWRKVRKIAQDEICEHADLTFQMLILLKLWSIP